MPALSPPWFILTLLIFLLPSSLCLSPQTVLSQPITSCGLDCSCSPPSPPSTPSFSICGAACCPPPSACADTSSSPPICMSSLQCAKNSSASFPSCTSALQASRSLAERYVGHLDADDLSSPALLQQLEASTLIIVLYSTKSDRSCRYFHFAIADCRAVRCS
jgi:hypothetical protein